MSKLLKDMKVKITFILFVLFCGILSAETRIYRYNGPINDFLPKFVDQLAESKLKFQITKQYNENTDGRLGFMMLVLPGRRLVDLQIFNEQEKTTLVKIFYENPWDGKIFHEIFIKLKMNEPDVKPIDDSLPPGWPKP
ncbi:MAG: hypothetical protein KatS3mg129_0952 [Leptospiraceae bacterium]|nr:MAG: hypothetical protein KatS3mg129_0952 [Leptospiraceae bacterium]